MHGLDLLGEHLHRIAHGPGTTRAETPDGGRGFVSLTRHTLSSLSLANRVFLGHGNDEREVFLQL